MCHMTLLLLLLLLLLYNKYTYVHAVHFDTDCTSHSTIANNSICIYTVQYTAIAKGLCQHYCYYALLW